MKKLAYTRDRGYCGEGEEEEELKTSGVWIAHLHVRGD